MPNAALANLAKARHISPERAEHLWNKAKGIVSREYGSRKKVEGYWALVMGITKKMMGMNEDVTEQEKQMLNESVMSSPSDWAEPIIKFKKLDDLPKGKPNTIDQVMDAMRALNKMVHAQAHYYGGKHSKLLPVGIAEGNLLRQITQLDEISTASVDDEMEAAYMACNRLNRRLGEMGDAESIDLLHDVIKHIGISLAKIHGKGC